MTFPIAIQNLLQIDCNHGLFLVAFVYIYYSVWYSHHEACLQIFLSLNLCVFCIVFRVYTHGHTEILKDCKVRLIYGLRTAVVLILAFYDR